MSVVSDGELAEATFHILGPAILCYVMWTVMVARLPATIVAISALTAPVVGVLSSMLFLGDVMTWQKGLALTAIILSITTTLFQPR
jgi:drug/metabolite transporter (DMT)-like permease